jgi:hypothetical protein
MYEKIRSRKSVPTLYEERLIVCLPFLLLVSLVLKKLTPSWTMLSLLRKLRLCAMLSVSALTRNLPEPTHTSLVHPCYKGGGKALCGLQTRRRSMIRQRALRVLCSRKSGKRALLFLPVLYVHSLPKRSVARSTDDVTITQDIHPRLQRHVKNRLQSIERGAGLDWATAEASGLLFASRNTE